VSNQQAPNYGRAGRDLRAATIVGLSLVAALVASLLISSLLFAGLVAFVMILTVHELLAALNNQLPRLVRFVVSLAAPVIVMSAYWGGSDALLTAFVASSLLVLTVRLPLGQEDYVSHVARAIFVLAYGPLFASFAVLLVVSDNGVQKVIALVLLTIATDLGGYAAGALFGAHPMAPKISPKKSWEGFAGAMLVQVTTGVLLWVFVFDDAWWQGALVGLLMVITATVGDLIESMIKRDLGIKDMSQLLPGHGGVMDRLDSLVVNAFIAWALFALFL
jgi:phosphatidate cytidylyltransferase